MSATVPRSLAWPCSGRARGWPSSGLACGRAVPLPAIVASSPCLQTRARAAAAAPPRAPQNDLEIFRLRGREREILTAPGPNDAFLVIVIQRWASAAPEPLPGGVAAGGGMAAAAAIGGAGAAAGK